MGNLLGRDEHLNSIEALKKYYFKHGKKTTTFTTSVKVINQSDGTTERLTVGVNIEFGDIRQRINIMWEDAGYTREEFRDKGLFGYYDCAWVPMNFENNMLIIKSNDSDKVIYVD
ncbi:hypothetical protein [Clostridium butyricum]|nr:hypothetical protein [Clostridium butyricum]